VEGRRVPVRLTRDAQRQVRGGHPWVFEQSITRASPDGACGDLAVLFDDKRRFLAIGLYDPASPIRVRVLHQGRPRPIDGAFWRDQLTTAFARRAELASGGHTTAYRCVHGENDGLGGLVVDRYDRSYVVKLDTAAWLAHLDPVIEALRDVAGPEPQRIVVRMSRTAQPEAERQGLADGTVVAGAPLSGPVTFRENGLVFEADLARGQKTGHFLDQRDNRARVGALAGGARVLDVFSCTGGFTVHAAAGGARSVHSIDASPHAIAAVAGNLAANRDLPAVQRCRTSAAVGDAFTQLAELAHQGRRYDLVVVDPPSFAARQADVARALAAYRRLTILAAGLVEPGGLLVQSSCSSRIPTDTFFAAVIEAATASGHRMVELQRTEHPADHPIGFPQGAYLKTLFARLS
jgi:23S rRNA (cytosine1962-C5)-methyltransferase